MFKKWNKILALFMAVVLCSVMSIEVKAGEAKTWDVYYSDANNNCTVYNNYFQKYTSWYYSAIHTARSSSTVATLIQPGYGTSFQKPSYAVGGSKIKFYVSSASGTYVYVNSVLSYLTAPASSSGIVTRPTINTSSTNDGE